MSLNYANLMLRVSKGDAKAFEQIFNSHSGLVLGYATRLLGGDRVKAEDVSQNVWINVVRHSAHYEERSEFVPWLLTIVRNATFNLSRTESRKRETVVEEFELSAIEAEGSAPDLRFFANEENELVKKAIDELPDQQREAIMIWITEEPSYEELAEKMQTTVSSVKSLLFRAKKSLAERLKAA